MASSNGKQTGVAEAVEMIRLILNIVLNVAFYVFVAYVVFRAAALMYDFSYQVFGNTTASDPPGINMEVTIDEGTSTMDIASVLEMNKVIKNRYAFYIKVKLQNYNILAGTFHINTSMTYDEILETISNYENAIEVEEETDDN